MRLWERISRWLTGTRRRYRPVPCSEAPEKLGDRTIYLVGEEAHEWHMILTCPCGCGEPIYLNLLSDFSPRWEYVVRWGEITVRPSVRRTIGCRSHFWIRRSEIVWV